MKNTNFAIYFDNAGFATLITRSYCHAYDDSDYGQELAGAVADLLGGSSPKNWDDNEPECRTAEELADRSTDADEIRSIIASGNWPDLDEDGEADVDFEGGDTERNFWAALRSETARRAAQSASGRATTAKLGPEGVQARAKAGAAARWSKPRPCANCGDPAEHRYANKGMGHKMQWLCGSCLKRAVGGQW